MTDKEKTRCPAIHPWTALPCSLPDGHGGNHDADTSGLSAAELQRQKERAAAIISAAVHVCRCERLLPEFVSGILFAQYVSTGMENNLSLDQILHQSQQMLLIAMRTMLERAETPMNATGGKG